MADTQAYPYETHLDIRYGPLERIDVQAIVDVARHPWYNLTLCRVNDSVVRLGVIRGEYHWNKHEKEDEFRSDRRAGNRGRGPTPLVQPHVVSRERLGRAPRGHPGRVPLAQTREGGRVLLRRRGTAPDRSRGPHHRARGAPGLRGTEGRHAPHPSARAHRDPHGRNRGDRADRGPRLTRGQGYRCPTRAWSGCAPS